MTLSDIVFIVTAFITVAAAIGVVTLKNIVHSALLLVLTFLGVAAIYFNLSADFLGLIQILVYTGAIAVLILFAIILLMGDDVDKTNPWNPKTAIIGFITAIGVTAGLGWSILNTSWNTATGYMPENTVAKLADLFLTDYIIAFQMAAVLILVAVIGSIILAKGAKE